MKTFLCLILCAASMSCSGVLFVREYSLERKPTANDLQSINRVASDHGFEEKGGEPVEWLKEEGLTDFLYMRLHSNDHKLVFSSGLLPGPTLYFYPGPDRWTAGKEKQVDAMIASLRERGLHLELMRPWMEVARSNP